MSKKELAMKRVLVATLNALNIQYRKKEKLSATDRLSQAIIMDRLEELRYAEIHNN